MIVSVSRRTDIPAFYSDWFFNRIKEGHVLVRNPMNAHQISRINLHRDIVDCFVFWTKNPEQMLDRLSRLDGYNYYFQFTITGYSRNLEPNVPPIDQSIKTFQLLSRAIGRKRVIWRYDPILFSQNMNSDYHIEHFNFIATQLNGYVERCVVSLLDSYKKTERNLKSIIPTQLSIDQSTKVIKTLKTIAQAYHIELVTCAEEIDLSASGIKHGKCIDDKLISEISGRHIEVSKDKTQRAECGCVASIDIGAYNTCRHGCLYCYANFDSNTVRKNVSLHNPDSPLLFGAVGLEDKITERKVLSCFKAQENIF